MSDLLERLKDGLRDRYTVEREAGRGGMATVFLARDRKLGREVAIKVLSPSVMTAVAGERFLREIRSPPSSSIPTSSRCSTPARRPACSTPSCRSSTARACASGC